MFVRADQLLIEQLQDRFPLHAIDFHWDGFEPHLECFDSESSQMMEFDLEDVEFSVSRKKTCIGLFDDDGKYVSCPKQASVSRFSQCPDCAGESWIPHQECIFEPRCEGEQCDLDFCKREHVLYIAFYDTRMKIGMSSTRRIEQRLIEQGADAFSIIGKWPNRKKAREAENEFSTKLRIPQSHRQEQLLLSLSRPVDAHGIEERFIALKETLGERHNLSPEPLQWLAGYPVELPLHDAPRLVESWGSHKGGLVGMKGRWLIFESDGIKALNLHDITSRFLARRLG